MARILRYSATGHNARALLTRQHLHDHAAQHLATQPLAALYAAWAALTALRQLQDDLAPTSSVAPLLSLRSPLLDPIAAITLPKAPTPSAP